MDFHNRKAFIYSLILHGLVVAALFVGGLIQWLTAAPNEKITIEYFTPSKDAPGPKDKKKGPKNNLPVSDHMAQPIQSLNPGKVPVIPKTPEPVEEPDPAPEPEPAPKKATKQATSKSTPVTNPEAQKVKADTSKKPARMTVADFNKKYGKAKDSKSKTASTKQSSKKRSAIPTIDSGSYSKELMKLNKPGRGDDGGPGGDGPGGYSGTEWDNWALSVHLKAKQQWEDDKPQDLLTMSIEADVVFTVSPAGSISNIRIIKGSGYPRFDNAVLQSLRTLGRVNYPPDGKSVNATLTYVMKEE
ncbi:MAG: TonB family protein [Verrucomicrobiota bacterium]|nr:TonB family protein [Verrucomicrobiota bacterium]